VVAGRPRSIPGRGEPCVGREEEAAAGESNGHLLFQEQEPLYFGCRAHEAV